MTTMILVVGATGLLGGTTCRLLTEAGKPVRAMVRNTADPARLEQLTGAGATLVRPTSRRPVARGGVPRGGHRDHDRIQHHFPPVRGLDPDGGPG